MPDPGHRGNDLNPVLGHRDHDKMTLHDRLKAVAEWFDGEDPDMFDGAESDLVGVLLEMGLLWLDVSQGLLRACHTL